MADEIPMADLIKRTKEVYGMTWREMGDQLGRSERMIRKIARGETSGETYRTSVTELYTHGSVDTLTPRRRAKDGHLVPVRAKQGAKQPTRTPKDTRGRRVGTNKRGRFSQSTTNLPDGNRLHHIEMPRSKGTGRQKGLKAFNDEMLKIARSQARKDKRVKLTLTVEGADGQRRQYQVGSKSGFHASDVRSDIRSDHGGSAEGWLTHQISSVYPDIDSYTVVSIDINEHAATRTKAERKSEDVARTRRTRWRR
ncbi:hypothetical protein [Citricoccus nitrophenolicus]|uniref:hypothetical protein n=1 Tax=Citricoccus nitrophenolicus TaxID=863575 RepID=UPI003606582B